MGSSKSLNTPAKIRRKMIGSQAKTDSGPAPKPILSINRENKKMPSSASEESDAGPSSKPTRSVHVENKKKPSVNVEPDAQLSPKPKGPKRMRSINKENEKIPLVNENQPVPRRSNRLHC